MKEQILTKKVQIFGIVQGVGFRPTVSRHAMSTGVTGCVCNMGPYVEIYVQGEEEQVDKFLYLVKHEHPKRAVILRMDVEEIPPEEVLTYEDFKIIESGKVEGEIFVSPDIAICEDCKREMYDEKDPRYLHPFINCTCCGPRLTILDAMPYDRARTSMADFPMCERCAYEYTHPETRRYDAQPVCCNECGPEVYLIGRKERGEEAIRAVRRAICEGKIVAIKGIGGFHLCCDASNETAVALLRTRKSRPMKPFAVMMRNRETVERECELTKEILPILEGHQKPIILLENKNTGTIAPSVAPDNPKIGVMLPYAPIHMLLFDYREGRKVDGGYEMPDVLIMTSANTSGAPICRDDQDAINELSDLCDLMLSHNRLIRLRADDSVMDFFEGAPYMIRRSRGYAPLPFMSDRKNNGCVLAIGGELKNTFCIGKESLYYPSPYIGDMEDLRTVKALEESVVRMEELLEAEPEVIACDMHPKYNTTIFAEELSAKTGLPLLKVQHHYAHILAGMVENNLSGSLIGISFDGTGYGTDGSIWGGECLIADERGFTRMGSVEPFLQVGGDLSAKEGWRIALSLLNEIYGKEKALALAESFGLCSKQEASILLMMAARKMNAVNSTSCGRLFDGVSALLGIRRKSSFEGEASTSLQFMAEKYDHKNEEHDAFPKFELKKTWGEERRFLLPTMELIKTLVEKKEAGEATEKLAYEFHQSLAELVLDACLMMREQTGNNRVVLSGGCFQNKLLLELSVGLLRKHEFEVYTHHLLPPNDGGICAGQAFYAMTWLLDQKGGK